jgi:hypothetical protein
MQRGFRENAEAIHGHHDITGPAVECVDEHQPYALRFNLFQELLESRPLRDLFAPRAAFVVLKEDGWWEITAYALLSDGASLCLDTVIVFLHDTGATYIAGRNK